MAPLNFLLNNCFEDRQLMIDWVYYVRFLTYQLVELQEIAAVKLHTAVEVAEWENAQLH